jgi:cell division protein ZapD
MCWAYRGNPAVSDVVLDDVGQIESCFAALSTLRAGSLDRKRLVDEHPQSRVGIPGGTCEFDLPAYYAWQHTLLFAKLICSVGSHRWFPCRFRACAAVAAETLVHRKGYGCGGHYQQTLPQGRTFSCCACASIPRWV